MKTGKGNPLPVHSLENNVAPVQVRDIAYKNPYDFTREHRHDYFEIFFFENGGGSQLIDFLEIPVLPNSSYIVFPQQVHLLKRGPESSGQLVQFREEILPSAQIRNLLRQVSFGTNPAIVFENNADKIARLQPVLNLLKQSTEKSSDLSNEIALSFLQALLLQLIESRESKNVDGLSEERKLLFEFQELLEANYRENHTVSKYASELHTTERKLSAVTKKFLGLSPLQVIHNRLLLEAKRILLFENTSHKEIAFGLGFDSPATFSQFIKTKTGHSPSDLYTHLVNIHK
jgi:AraC family transcriptional regulator, transcriptional activator of pobA